jgi:hypothetical protein
MAIKSNDTFSKMRKQPINYLLKTLSYVIKRNFKKYIRKHTIGLTTM